MNSLKVLTKEGLQHLWQKISLEDYPNNETLVAILNAIDETKVDKDILDLRIPESTNNDNGKFLRVINGTAAWVSVPNAEEASF